MDDDTKTYWCDKHQRPLETPPEEPFPGGTVTIWTCPQCRYEQRDPRSSADQH